MEKKTSEKLTEFVGDWENRYASFKLFPPFTYQNGKVRLFKKYPQDGASLHSIDLNKKLTNLVFSYNHPQDLVLYGKNSDALLVEEWSGNKYALMIYPKDGSKAQTIFSGTDRDERQIHPIARLPNPDEVLVELIEQDTTRVHVYNLKEKSLGRLVLSDELYDVEASEIVMPYSGEVVGLYYDADRPKISYFDEEIKREMAFVDTHLPRRVNLIVSASADKKRFIILSESDVQLGEYFLYTPEKKELKKLLGKAEWLPEEKLSEVLPVRYQSRDGLSIEAYFTRPKYPAKGRPLIVFPHGGPHARDTWRYDEWVQFFASRGVAVIQPNYRISTGYGRKFFEKGWHEVGYAIQDDIVDAMTWAQGQGFGKEGNMCIAGASFGAYAAMREATLLPDAFRCVIAIAGFYDVNKLLEEDKNRPYFFFMKTVYGDPEKDKQRLFDASPVNSIDKLKVPVLIAHGKLDSRVPYEQATELIEALKKSNKVYETLLLEDEGHSFLKPSNRQKLFEQMDVFLNRYLLGGHDQSDGKNMRDK